VLALLPTLPLRLPTQLQAQADLGQVKERMAAACEEAQALGRELVEQRQAREGTEASLRSTEERAASLGRELEGLSALLREERGRWGEERGQLQVRRGRGVMGGRAIRVIEGSARECVREDGWVSGWVCHLVSFSIPFTSLKPTPSSPSTQAEHQAALERERSLLEEKALLKVVLLASFRDSFD
jgi:hypothetical protein